ncbi:ComEC/Rec2 family competence protein [Anoxynatronum sibiricum]|uniref:ComEC/Rec2 family competence protein n=1 Tax=Anoxynatronum sibiricum TaxID=210623 RepID=A0ABU9VRE9_9CLOT
MKRPAMMIVPAFTLGMLLESQTQAAAGWLILPVALMAAIGLVKLDDRRALFCIVLLACLMGFHRQQMENAKGTSMMGVLSTDDVTDLKIMVTHIGNSSRFSTRYEGLIQQIVIETENIQVKVPVIIELTYFENDIPRLMPGQILYASSFQVVHDLSTAATEPWLENWRSRGFHGVIQLTGKEVRVSESANWWRLRAYQLRKFSEKSIDSRIAEPESQVLKSIFFGERRLLNQDQLQHFSRTGTAHLIAVSGLHVGILAVVIQFILQKTGAGKRGALVTTALAVWCYAAMTGFSISILRAAVMHTCYVAAFFLKRRYDAKSSLLWCALLFAFVNPLALRTVSYQLSFLATGGILWLYPPLRSCLYPEKLPVLDLLLVTMAAQLGTWPVVAVHFETFSLVAIPANFLIVPVMGVLMPLALVMIVAGLLHPILAVLPGIMVTGGIRYIIAVTSYFSQWPWAEMQVSFLSSGWLIGYGLALAIIWKGLSICEQSRLVQLKTKISYSAEPTQGGEDNVTETDIRPKSIDTH